MQLEFFWNDQHNWISIRSLVNYAYGTLKYRINRKKKSIKIIGV